MLPGIRGRGPDGTGSLAVPGMGLLHTRLAIIDLVTGDQPIWNETRTIACILNGEIYNYRELTAQLGERHRFSTRSDTEVLVHLYEDHGPELVQHLRGMYAFAIWDAPRRRLLLARDRLGIKPLYVTRLEDGFAFASSIESLLGAGSSRDPDPEALAQFLRFQKVPEPRTAYRAVRALPPSHLATVDARTGSVEVRRFYALPRVAPSPARDAVPVARAAFERAVASHLVADVEVAAFLSGGIDSSLVVAQAQRSMTRPLRTFCVSFRGAGAEYDESEIAATVAQRLGTRHETIDVSDAPADLVRAALRVAQQPFAVTSFVPLLLLAEKTAKHVKVVLTGDGGDEVGFGYPWYRWMRAAAHIPAVIRRRGVGQTFRTWETRASAHRLNRVRRALKFARGALSDGPRGSDAWRYELTSDEAVALLRPEHRPAAVPPSPNEAGWDGSLDDVSALRRVDLEVLLRDEMLPKLDRAGMAFGLEGRVPLLDDDFVGAMLAIPRDSHLRDGVGKSILRAWARELVPGVDLERPKHGFDVPIRAWLLNGLRDDVNRLVLDRSRPGLVEPAAARRVWDHLERGVPGAAHAMYAMLMAATWFDEKVLAR
jgi:asparagine synthase (glutamine-hydrolysing)